MMIDRRAALGVLAERSCDSLCADEALHHVNEATKIAYFAEPRPPSKADRQRRRAHPSCRDQREEDEVGAHAPYDAMGKWTEAFEAKQCRRIEQRSNYRLQQGWIGDRRQEQGVEPEHQSRGKP